MSRRAEESSAARMDAPTAAGTGRLADTRTDRLIRLWTVTIPRRIESWAPRLADAFSDGAWTAIWPRVTAYAPVAAFVVGFAVTLLLPFAPDSSTAPDPRVWSELLPFIMLVVACGILLGTTGVGLLAGVVLGDLLALAIGAATGGMSLWYRLGDNPLFATVILVGSATISYLLLSIPAVTLPLFARSVAERTPLRPISSPLARKIARTGVYLLAVAVLTFLWTRAVVVLIRPVFTWRFGSPTVEAIVPVQDQWRWIVGAAVVAVLLRVVLQELVVRRSPRASMVAALQLERWEGARPGAFWRRAGPVPFVVFTAAIMTLLLAGTYEHPIIDPAVVFIVAALAAAWRVALIRPSGAWVRIIERVPPPVRLLVALLVGYLLARLVLEAFYATTTNSLRPVLIAILLVMGVFVALFPSQAAIRTRRSAV